ncbi:hypothetical protein SPI_08157 [Niveomyces insectorum RCEF 264]|uniref:Ddenn domain containing protein n=1 Tax=Niveomyces insectorum RCEF 264 TaxID=1081102 RepID=A0A162MH27_9HYPO|nr:hypothetical protein SPI_08157 [Niveomyces insectorum RCEF 264]
MDPSVSTPLADYFWIAGVESISYQDLPPPPSQQIEATIDEHDEPDAAGAPKSPAAARTTTTTARHSRQSSANRLSKLSLENRMSIHTLEDLDDNTRSNRSSTTIKAPPPQAPSSTLWDGIAANGSGNGTTTNGLANGLASGLANGFANGGGGVGGGGGGGANGRADFDFDQLLVKFAVERENFLEDLSFSAGAKLQPRPPMVNPRTEKIKADDADANARLSPLRSIRGSIRRKLSFRDMNSMRKPHSAPRAASVRTSRRLSNYNSVIPPPEPLNVDPEMHPLKRRFEPVLLDRYPPRSATADDLARRGKFPDYVPMFAFPNDIQIVSSDDRPRSTWHGFTMTSDDNSKIYGIALVIWTALKADVAEQVEKRCEQWRQSHMSDEERELAASLGMRLAAERAHLSQLLAKLPGVPSGSSARETLDDQISVVEEKIGLMTEMLRPLRHGAASKIDGLTLGETGLWVPRAYGVLGRDPTRTAFWKDWLRAVVVPMTDGAVLRVPPSSPKVGRWQPLERYVVNLCTEAFSPLSSKTQVEVGVRELRLYARKEAENELPGARNTDLFALFRCLSLENIVTLFEYVMVESRIIFLSSHAAMLHLACHAVANLLYPLKWASIFVPLLPARLLSVLDAPCPYIVGIERRYERIELPEDDFVLVDLDKDSIEATHPPTHMPRQHRRKLCSLLQMAAPHRLRYGVPAGPPPYAIETFPYDAFSAENESLFNPTAPKSTLGKWVTQNSANFGEHEPAGSLRLPIFNAFVQLRNEFARADRPQTAKSGKTSPPTSLSPVSTSFPPLPPLTPVSRSDSGFAANQTQTLREKRSGHFEDKSRRSSSFGVADRQHPLHRPSLQYLNGHAHAHAHGQSMSISAVSIDSQSSYGGYAPSTYAQSTLAASTVMPNMVVQPVHNTETTMWVEGHCFNFGGSGGSSDDASGTCTVCAERSDGEGLYRCAGCKCVAHNRCLGFVSLVCPEAFNADKVRAAFVRCMASMFYTYRKFLGRPSKDQKANGQLYAFDINGFIRSLPYEQQEYVTMLRNTQAFNEFIHERETRPPSHTEIRLFDEIILAKKARGRPGLGGFGGGLSRLSTIKASHGISPGLLSAGSRPTRIPPYLGDTSDHIWRTASVPVPSAKFPGEYHAVTTRVPAKLDPSLMKEPRAIQGVPRPEQRGARGVVRKQVASMLGPSVPLSNFGVRET